MNDLINLKHYEQILALRKMGVIFLLFVYFGPHCLPLATCMYNSILYCIFLICYILMYFCSKISNICLLLQLFSGKDIFHLKRESFIHCTRERFIWKFVKTDVSVMETLYLMNVIVKCSISYSAMLPYKNFFKMLTLFYFT